MRLNIIARVLLACAEVTDWLLRFYARLTGWSPIGRRVSIAVTEGEPEIFGMIVTGVIRDVDNVLEIALSSPWHYRNRTTSVADVIAVQPRFAGQSAYHLLLGSLHGCAFPIIDANKPRVFAGEDVIALCIVRFLPRHVAK